MKKVTYREFEDFENNLWNEFLESATNEEIHMSIVTVNYDDLYRENHPLVSYILTNNKIDKGSILTFYWKQQPQYLPTKEFLNVVENNYLKNFYSNEKIFFNPTNDNGENWTEVYEKTKLEVREVPLKMKEIVQGETVPELFEVEDFEDGLPIRYAEKIMDYLNEHQIIEE